MPALRPIVDGKFFRIGRDKFFVKGLSYGPFGPETENDSYASPEQTARDFALVRELGANVLRVYHVPPHWLLDLAEEHGLRLFIDIPWPKHVCFLDKPETRALARDKVRQAAGQCRNHPAVFAYSVVNEPPADVVRWSGAAKVADFIDELIDVVKSVDPEGLCTFTSFPPIEYLRPANQDFLSFNVYLHQPRSMEAYLARLQMIAHDKPLLLSEFGMDSYREGEDAQAEFLSSQVEIASRGGLAGAVAFSFTDDWHRGGFRVEDWAFGITTRDRKPKPAFAALKEAFKIAPYYPLKHAPKVSVVVAAYNAARTLKPCLDSLQALNYPDYEVILVDDGSNDATGDIARRYSNVRYLHHPNAGLSVARNTGIEASLGEIVAFTDADCRADEDWLYYAVSDLLAGDNAAVGGHNFLPPEDSLVAAAVMASPGGPAHVMKTDREAEHVPGCNMVFFKWALREAGLFDPIFRKAGDDVDICWRLLERGRTIGFSPSGFVWHYRRSTVAAYLKQQSGYGEAEALLARKHPEYFNMLGMGLWRGRIYSSAKYGVLVQRPVIYHGLFGSGFFQRLYTPEPAHSLMLLTTIEYHALVTAPLMILSTSFMVLLPVGITSLLISLAVCAAAAWQADLPKKKRRVWSRPLVALLFFLQPVVRGWARYRWRLYVRSAPKPSSSASVPKSLPESTLPVQTAYWSDKPVERYSFLDAVLEELQEQGWQYKTDTGWSPFDIEIFDRWVRLRITTATEELEAKKRCFRCRLASSWSLRAHIFFWSAAGMELVAIGYLAQQMPWCWMILLSLLILFWVIDYEKRVMEARIAALLDDVAREHALVPIEAKTGKSR